MVTFDFVKTPITQIADFIIVQSAKSNASDIHFDPRDNGLIVRMRVDGELRDYTFIPKVYERNLITRLKLLASMNITESRLPQDGAIKGNIGGIDLDMRVSCLPTNEGEKIVIRILDYSRSFGGLESLGFSEENFKKLHKMIHVPNGIILVTGATGTGKSTTTYAILQELNTEETNIITVEDPIEMNIEGMNQVQVNSDIGLDFATVLRSILRQDPNIILIGEIRDSETAQIAVRASITGHLVLSTIHTNNSLSTIERLVDMDVERYLLSSALTGIISQKLAKKLCPKCRVQRETNPYEKKVFKIALNKDVDKIYAAHEAGCPECNHGYKGRIAVHEVLEIDDYIREALADATVKKESLREVVYTSNVITMLQDALLKVLSGLTTFEEIYRIIDIDDDIETVFRDEQQAFEENIKNESKDKKLKLEDNILNQSIASSNGEKKEENQEVVNNEVESPSNSQITLPVDNTKTEDTTNNNIQVNENTVSLPTAKTEQPVVNTTTTEANNKDNIPNQDTVSLPTAKTEQPVVNTTTTETNSKDNIPNQDTVSLPSENTLQQVNNTDTSVNTQTNENVTIPAITAANDNTIDNNTPDNGLNDSVVSLPIIPTVDLPEKVLEQPTGEIKQIAIPNLDFNIPNTKPDNNSNENIETGNIKIVPPTDNQVVDKEDIFDNMNDIAEEKLTVEDKEEEKYYDSLGVKPVMTPTVDTNKKIDATVEKTAVDKSTALTPNKNIVNMSVPSDVPIAQPKQT